MKYRIIYYIWGSLVITMALPFSITGAVVGALFSTIIRGFYFGYKTSDEAVLGLSRKLRKKIK